MSTRINQEVLEIGVPSVSSAGGNTRMNQLTLIMLVPTSASGSLTGQRVQIVGGPFQDALGNPIANGYLLFQLQHDAAAVGSGQIVGNSAVVVPLDTNGFIQGTVTGLPVFIWPNNVLSPAGGTYVVWAYNSSNGLVWDNPQIQSVNSTPNPFNVNNWVPGP